MPEDLAIYYITVYNKGQVWIGNTRGLYGSDTIYESKPRERGEKYSYEKIYPMKHVHWKMLDLKDQRCTEGTGANTTKCIIQFLEHTFGCSMMLPERNTELDLYY